MLLETPRKADPTRFFAFLGHLAIMPVLLSGTAGIAAASAEGNMYAIVRTGGKEYKVSPGDVVRVERQAGKTPRKGDGITLSEVLLVADGDTIRSGDPLLSGAAVKATILAPTKSRKVLVFKKKRTKQYRRTRGHRQAMLELRIDSIEI
jgi:large subunit ribosomal protein L21